MRRDNPPRCRQPAKNPYLSNTHAELAKFPAFRKDGYNIERSTFVCEPHRTARNQSGSASGTAMDQRRSVWTVWWSGSLGLGDWAADI